MMGPSWFASSLQRPHRGPAWARSTVRAAIAVAVLGMTIAPTAYAAFRIAAHNGWIIATLDRRDVVSGKLPSVPEDSGTVSLLLVGDTGKASTQRTQVVDAMADQWAWMGADGVVLLGDNFYESGVASVEDPRFQTDFERVFPAARFDAPFFACLGNHDHNGNVEAQVAYSRRSDRWWMPARYYQTSLAADGVTVDLFVLDTVSLGGGGEPAERQLRWLADSLSASTATWRVVVGHHPCLSGGKHGASEPVAVRLAPLLERYRVDLYVSGHEHDLQLLDSGHGWLQVVSGSGSKLRSTRWIRPTRYAAATAGFAWLLLNDSTLSISFFGDGRHLFTQHAVHQPRRSNPKPAAAEQRSSGHLACRQPSGARRRNISRSEPVAR